MSYHDLGRAITSVVVWLNNNQIKYALVGGLAVSFRALERATKDIDVAIATTDDTEAENIILSLQSLGFHPATLLENKKQKRISTVRLLSAEFPGVYLDLLFATSGIEPEVVESAEPVEVLPEVIVQLATRPSLLAMKVLSSTSKHRRQDLLDIDNLFAEATTEEIIHAKKLVSLIQERGFNHQQDLLALFDKLLTEFNT